MMTKSKVDLNETKKRKEKRKNVSVSQGGIIRIRCDVFCLLYFRGLGKQGYQCQGEKTHIHCY